MTTDARSVILATRHQAAAAKRDRMTPSDLAAALAVPTGNTAGVWAAPAAEPAAAVSAPRLRFDGALRRVLKQAAQAARAARAQQIGTEHLLAALVRTGPPGVVTWLAERGATTEAVDELLARLGTGRGVERLPDEPSPEDQRGWERAMTGGFPYVTVIVSVVVAVVLFVLCVWGP
ncbi:hypothetical protein OHA72_28390 [Dactylosporangium sp. NBC_01737]|uniref:Clp protease N-terminal domain-containing protein n=1 Tax=Dactylosporangium sp. NBC_01737 TaxID=2975959 RepID=UPI002E105842|nr:hypothetical protein OHA72_28390 [Dactylosporangium sp. NBC_01737]